MQAFDWSTGTETEHLDLARDAPPEDLPHLARSYDWSMYPETVLGWVMAQKGIDLGAALEVFFNGEPERFNYMRKHDVPEEYHGAARVLDNICLRVNSGFYLAYPHQDVAARKRVARWLEYQQCDREEGRRGRWILDETILSTLLEDTLRFDRSEEDERYFDEPSLMRDLFSPIMELELSRRIMRMLPIKPR
ncbi:hypothetical protein FDP25_00370 [Roseovarius sp. A21]|uniref:DUF4274 domain-containing protein n=1 Tax=Roseovarius bejariae TaxID=2576383 RepID=A0A844CGR6_9RHOB|nr:hypothetical protein [Roseovarius bejariae]MRU13882.1 hypothetical protein [Roseovarius bejariae]